jgi:hypothetical protein
VLVFVALAGAQASPANDQPWRAAFDEAYGLSKGQAIRHVPPPFIPERLDFYKWAAASQAQAVPDGPMSMTVRWAGENPRFGGGRFGGGNGDAQGMTVRQILQGVIGLKPQEFDAPRELLDMELAGDWSVRYRAKQPELLAGLAEVLSAITKRKLSFAREKSTIDAVVVRGSPKRPADLPPGDTWPLQLDVKEVEFLRPFGGAGPLESLFDVVGRATGWPVIEQWQRPDPPPVVSWSGNRVTEDDDLERIDRAALDRVINAIAKETGLELTVEPREVERWKLVEKK